MKQRKKINSRKPKGYYRNPDDAQAAAQAEYYRSGIAHEGRFGGPDCPVQYGGDGRGYVSPIPANQTTNSCLD